MKMQLAIIRDQERHLQLTEPQYIRQLLSNLIALTNSSSLHPECRSWSLTRNCSKLTEQGWVLTKKVTKAGCTEVALMTSQLHHNLPASQAVHGADDITTLDF